MKLHRRQSPVQENSRTQRRCRSTLQRRREKPGVLYSTNATPTLSSERRRETTPHTATGPDGKEADETEASIFDAASGHAHAKGTHHAVKSSKLPPDPRRRSSRDKRSSAPSGRKHSRSDEENLTGVGTEEQELRRRNAIRTEDVGSDKRDPRRRGHRLRRRHRARAISRLPHWILAGIEGHTTAGAKAPVFRRTSCRRRQNGR